MILSYQQLFSCFRADINEIPVLFCCNDLIPVVRNAQESCMKFIHKIAVVKLPTAITDMHVFCIYSMGNNNIFIFGHSNNWEPTAKTIFLKKL